MNAYEIICEESPHLVKLSTELWQKYMSGSLEDMFRETKTLFAKDYFEYQFILLCLIHVMEGGTFE